MPRLSCRAPMSWPALRSAAFMDGEHGKHLVCLTIDASLQATTTDEEAENVIGREPPKEFVIARAGLYESTKGVYLFDDLAAEICIQAWDEYSRGKVDGMIDWNHASIAFLVVDPKLAGAAAGWYRLEKRPAMIPVVVQADGKDLTCSFDLYAVRVRWVDDAAKMLQGGQYRYYSPVFELDDVGRIVLVFNVALTNTPATKGQTALVEFSRSSKGVKLMDLQIPDDCVACCPPGSTCCGYDAATNTVLFMQDGSLCCQKCKPGPDGKMVPDGAPMKMAPAPSSPMVEEASLKAEQNAAALARKQLEQANAKVIALTVDVGQSKARAIELEAEHARQKAELETVRSDAADAMTELAISSGRALPARRAELQAQGRKGGADLATLKALAFKASAQVPPKFTPPASGGSSMAVNLDAYVKMSPGQRIELSKQDPDTFKQLSDAHRRQLIANRRQS